VRVVIDWVTALVPCTQHAPITGGRAVVPDADGSVEWESPRHRVADGSYASTIRVRIARDSTQILISGKPAKWLQGHNLFNDGHDTRALQHYVGHKNIVCTVR
jgi:II/X family phage/plasmid replication protein